MCFSSSYFPISPSTSPIAKMDTYSDSDRASLATYQTEESSHNHAAPRLSWLRRLCGGTSSNDGKHRGSCGLVDRPDIPKEDQEASRLVTNASGKRAPNTKKAEEELLVYRDQLYVLGPSVQRPTDDA